MRRLLFLVFFVTSLAEEEEATEEGGEEANDDGTPQMEIEQPSESDLSYCYTSGEGIFAANHWDRTWYGVPANGEAGVGLGTNRKRTEAATQPAICGVQVTTTRGGSWTSRVIGAQATMPTLGHDGKPLTGDGCDSTWRKEPLFDDAGTKWTNRLSGYRPGEPQATQDEEVDASITCYCNGKGNPGCNLVANFEGLVEDLVEEATFEDRCPSLEAGGDCSDKSLGHCQGYDGSKRGFCAGYEVSEECTAADDEDVTNAAGEFAGRCHWVTLEEECVGEGVEWRHSNSGPSGKWAIRRLDGKLPSEYRAGDEFAEVFWNTEYEFTFTKYEVAGKSYFWAQVNQLPAADGAASNPNEVPEVVLDGFYKLTCNDFAGAPTWIVQKASNGGISFTAPDAYTWMGDGFMLVKTSSTMVNADRAINAFQWIAIGLGSGIGLLVIVLGIYCKCRGDGDQTKSGGGGDDVQYPNPSGDRFSNAGPPPTSMAPERGETNAFQAPNSGPPDPFSNASSKDRGISGAPNGSFQDVNLQGGSATAGPPKRGLSGVSSAPIETTGNEELPPGWRSALDPNTGRTYYVSPDNQTQWTPPAANANMMD